MMNIKHILIIKVFVLTSCSEEANCGNQIGFIKSTVLNPDRDYMRITTFIIH